MIRIVSNNKIYFLGKLDEFIEVLEDMQKKYKTVKEAIDDIKNN